MQLSIDYGCPALWEKESTEKRLENTITVDFSNKPLKSRPAFNELNFKDLRTELCLSSEEKIADNYDLFLQVDDKQHNVALYSAEEQYLHKKAKDFFVDQIVGYNDASGANLYNQDKEDKLELILIPKPNLKEILWMKRHQYNMENQPVGFVDRHKWLAIFYPAKNFGTALISGLVLTVSAAAFFTSLAAITFGISNYLLLSMFALGAAIAMAVSLSASALSVNEKLAVYLASNRKLLNFLGVLLLVGQRLLMPPTKTRVQLGFSLLLLTLGATFFLLALNGMALPFLTASTFSSPVGAFFALNALFTFIALPVIRTLENIMFSNNTATDVRHKRTFEECKDLEYTRNDFSSRRLILPSFDTELNSAEGFTVIDYYDLPPRDSAKNVP